MSRKRVAGAGLVLVLCGLLAACGGGGGGGGGGGAPASIQAYSIGGSVSGLRAGTSVTLLDNGGSPLQVSADGSFTLPTPLASGSAYVVTVGTQPTGQNCSVSGGSGSVSSGNVTTVAVTCLNQGESVLYSFGLPAGSDGQDPYASLVMDASGNLYGTTYYGGTNDTGTVFKITSSGAESVLYSFGPNTGSDGQYPAGSLIMDASGNLYGATQDGGKNGTGTVFKIIPSGAESVLYSFGPSPGADGKTPTAGLVMDASGNLYGTTQFGSTSDSGTVFQITPSGTESVLHSFGTGNDGNGPEAGLIMDASGNLYGTTYSGGTNGKGTVFKISPSGTESVLHSFGTGTDGQNPQARLIMDRSGNLYGTTSGGGANGTGTVFQISPSGAESVLYSFGTGTDGQSPLAGLVMDASGNLYGTTYSGGTNGTGTVFRIVP